MTAASGTPLDRRARLRHRGWFATRVDAQGGGAMAVAHNLSEGGALLCSRRPIDVGRTVHLSLHVNPSVEPPWILAGTVVRSLPNDADPHGLWPHRVAIEFAQPVPELFDSMLGD